MGNYYEWPLVHTEKTPQYFGFISSAAPAQLMFCFSGGIPITVTGENVDSVQEPVMVVVVKVEIAVSTYFQVNDFATSV